VFIGDPHQHIYGFRGAINILEELEGTTHTYSLTQVRTMGNNKSIVAKIYVLVHTAIYKDACLHTFVFYQHHHP
jgi:hypothetical protein